jgi:hypothetical protein
MLYSAIPWVICFFSSPHIFPPFITIDNQDTILNSKPKTFICIPTTRALNRCNIGMILKPSYFPLYSIYQTTTTITIPLNSYSTYCNVFQCLSHNTKWYDVIFQCVANRIAFNTCSQDAQKLKLQKRRGSYISYKVSFNCNLNTELKTQFLSNKLLNNVLTEIKISYKLARLNKMYSETVTEWVTFWTVLAVSLSKLLLASSL